MHFEKCDILRISHMGEVRSPLSTIRETMIETNYKADQNIRISPNQVRQVAKRFSVGAVVIDSEYQCP